MVGATSSLAQVMCRKLAARGDQLVLSGRDGFELETLAADLHARYGISAHTILADFLGNDFAPYKLLEQAGDFTHLILATGDMGKSDISSLYDIAYTAHVNYTIPAQIAALAAPYLASRQSGHIVIISSVAGDRGRAKIAAYGSAKSALTAFASALRQHYAKHGVHVLTVKPGFTDTSMTWGMKSPLIASRESVADAILRAMDSGRDVLYTPWFWRAIMLAIQHIPERMFKRLSF